ncbi:hypothetical protein CEP52_006715 [Fusarium oligoseptatum]|uniref:Uncharacterized protein n=1 Tax=Fusarium oligoseptatum TaxID=2604345 RepID=A0A428TRF3_9HYPO|nr:hypothetical protein CEP52_006715 [Fusarium oligoseptatum]
MFISRKPRSIWTTLSPEKGTCISLTGNDILVLTAQSVLGRQGLGQRCPPPRSRLGDRGEKGLPLHAMDVE